MLIDWTTVIFQIINFLILIILLKRFLYGPVIKAMDDREKVIGERLAEAARAEQEGRDYAARLAAEQQEFAGKREQLQQEARQEIEAWQEKSLARLQGDLADQRQNWQNNLAEEQEAFLRKLKITVSRQVFEVARKVLADLADHQLEARLIEVFLAKIALEADIDSEMPGPLTIISGFPLADVEKKNLEAGLRKFFPGAGELIFREESELGFGIRLLSGDRKWEWNLSRYMNNIEDEIIRTISATK